MKVLLKITKDVLKRSAHCDTENADNLNSNCAVALAMNDLIPDTTVGYEMINFKRFTSIPQPPDMFRWIRHFDNLSPEKRMALPEVSFEVELSDQIIDSIGISSVYKVLSESKTLELVSIQ